MQAVTRCLFDDLFYEARRLGASDVHLSPDRSPAIRVDGSLRTTASPAISERALAELFEESASCNAPTPPMHTDCTFVLSEPLWGRTRLHWTQSRAGITCAARLLPIECPTAKTLGISQRLCDLVQSSHGLLLIVGSTGSGKSTTLAALLALAAAARYRKIVTLEQPIEFDLSSLPGNIEQRALGTDVPTLHDGVFSALRSDPDVIAIGEVRSADDCNALLRAAETGHLVLATMHAADAASSIDRMLRSFPGDEAGIARTVLADVLIGVSAQRLVPQAAGGRALESELLLATDAVRAIVRDGKCYQLRNAMTLGGSSGMKRFTGTQHYE
ncbi:MAG: type IV pilus twitching motility protein PilT [Candidatus Baltobacteraceae bacterium]